MVEEGALAVVGMACRLPGAEDPAALWQNVLADRCAIGPMPAERFHRERYFDPEIGAYGKSYSAIGGLLEERADLTGIPQEVTRAADVAHLWALEVARETFEDAGVEPGALRGRRAGVIIGHARGSMLTSDLAFGTAVEGLAGAIDRVPALAAASGSMRSLLTRQAIDTIRRRYPTRGGADLYATLASALAGRISAAFGLDGRHCVVDAACASSFAAIDAAARALQARTLDVALAGGASYSQELSVVLFAQSRALSGDGSFPFDERANGFVSSDGLGFFLLMRLEDAIAARARIRAVIRGIGGSCDGKGKALWAPRKEGQVLAMRRAYEAAGIEPRSLGLLECHATSTPIGDATEVAAVHELFGASLRKEGRLLPIGSIKGNIGHAREAAGAAGLIKAICAIEHQTLPPTGSFRVASKAIPWDDVAVEVVTTATPWHTSDVRRAGVNAFGIGGLNYHLIVEEPPPSRRVMPVSSGDTTSPRLRIEALDRASRPPKPLDIAIVGVGTRLPGASDPGTLWTRLLSGAASFGEVPPDRWKKELFLRAGEAVPYRTYTARGSFLGDFKADWRRYKVPPKLVEQNDPLQFMLLEAASDALEDAGIDPAAIDRTRVAVLMGTVFGSDYALDLSLSIRAVELAEAVAEAASRPGDRALIEQLTAAVRESLPSINEDSSGSFSSSTLASRVAKTLDLMGPTYTVDASCGASFAALEAACELLRAGGADLAIFGGGDRAMRVQRYATYAQAGVLGRGEDLRALEPGADGFFPAEGAAICVLERLEDAERSGHQIYGVIRGIGSASETSIPSVQAPSGAALELAMRRALESAGVDPASVSAIETHGLGVPAFDSVELQATRAVYGDRPLLLGATKRIAGHAPGAAGATALAKVALSLEHRIWPPLGGPAAERSELQGSLQLPATATPLTGEVIAAISGLSFGGASHHLIVSAAPGGAGPRKRRTESEDRVTEIRFTPGQWAGGWRPEAWVEQTREAALVARDPEEREERLALLARAGVSEASRPLLRKNGVWPIRSGRPRVALLFSGQGSQYQGMLAELPQVLPAARALLDRADAWLHTRGRAPISEAIYGPGQIGDDVFLVQASLLIADLMAFEAVRAAGIEPELVTGHSYGDYPALVAAGAWTLEQALEATLLRAEAITHTVEPGGMMSVLASRGEVEAVLATLPGCGTIVASNLNAPAQTVVSGAPAALEAARDAFSARSIETRALAVPRAFHSPLMAAARERLARTLDAIPLKTPELRFLSSVTATELSDPREIRAALVEQLTRPVDFVAQIERLLALGVDTFVECGPKAVLTGLVDQIAAGTKVDAVPSDDAARPGRWAIARIAALLASRRAEAAPQAAGLSLLGDAEELLNAPGFSEFWARTQPSIAALVKSLWAAEQQKPAPGAARDAGQVAAQVAIQAAKPVAAPSAPRVIATEPRQSVPLAPASSTRDEVKQFLIDAFCAQTGYPADLIDPDADLEADLGIDTVKQAQVLGKVRDRYQLRADQSLSLADFPTVHRILAYVEKQLAERERAPQRKRPSIPVVDVIARRTEPPPAAAVAPRAAIRPSELPSRPVPRVTLDGGAVAEAPRVSAPPVKKSHFAPVEVLHLSGTAREIGRQHGEALKHAIRDTMDRYELFLGDRSLSALSVPEATRFLPRLFDEDTLEEIRGIAEGVGVPFEHLVAYNLDAALFPAYAPGCTQALRTARSNGGRLLHAANEDSPLLLHLGAAQTRVVQVRKRSDAPDPKRRTVLFSLAGQVAGPNAATDAGLTITSCTLLDAEPPRGLPDGLPHPQLVKRVIEAASDLTEAEALICGAPRSGRWSLLISRADTDRALYLEYDGAEILTRREIDQELVATNHAFAGPAAGASAPEHSLHRLSRAQALIGGTEPRSTAQLVEALRDRYDLARGRVVPHATMNTVRRADNVMTLVVEPKERRLLVSDRVLPPGSGDEVGFLQISYGEDPPSAPKNGSNGHARYGSIPPAAVESVRHIGDGGRGVVTTDEVMRRSIVRVVSEPAPEPVQRFVPRSVLLTGSGARVDVIRTELEARGSQVTVAADCAAALELLGDRSMSNDFDALGLVLETVEGQAWEVPEEAWSQRRKRLLEDPFALLRAWVPGRKAGTIFAVTVLGGGLGFENVAQGVAEHGGLCGLLKAIRREHDGLTVQLLDTGPSSSPEQVARALLAELDAGSPRLEAGLLRNKRVRLVMAPRPADDFSKGAERLPASWVVTGGARGITAEIAVRLAELYRPELHLIGRQPLPPPEARAELCRLDAAGIEARKQQLLAELRARGAVHPKEWAARCEALDKTIEIARNLSRIEAAGSRVTYWAADLSDRGTLAAVLEKIRAKCAIEGLIHGAGVEVAKPFAKKSAEVTGATLGAKVDGLVHLLALTAADPLTHVIGFSSVSGRFGGHGQTDYSQANEALARIIGAYRSSRPEVRATAICWPAWSEVGLAARSSARAFLEQTGQRFMSPVEGANHLVRELWSGLQEPELTVCENLDALDLDHLLVPEAEQARWSELDRSAHGAPLLGRVILSEPERLITERTVHAGEPFLDQHRIGATPILPAVIGLELLSELVALESDRWSIGEVKIHQPLKLAEGTSMIVRGDRSGDRLALTVTPRRPDGVVLEQDRVQLSALRLARRPLPSRVLPEWTGEGVPYPYPETWDRTPGSRMIYHGPVFRCLEAVQPTGEGHGLARLTVPPVEALCPGSRGDSWRIPAALLDGCLQAAGVLGRLLSGVFALPSGFGRIDVSPRAVVATGKPVLLEIRQKREGDELVSDLYATSEGEPLLLVERYRAQILGRT